MSIGADPEPGLLSRIVSDMQAAGGDPLYLKMAQTIGALIEAGELRGGAALPSERDLAKAAGCSRVTVRKAIDELCRKGIVSRRHGAGSFVAKQIDQPLSVLVGFTEDMKRRGAVATSRVLEREVALADPSDILKLGLSPTETVLRLTRVRLSDGEPLAIESAVVPASAIDIPSMGESLYDALRASGNMPVRALQRIHAGIATAEDAGLLGTAPGSPVLRIERRSFLSNGRAIEVTTSSYRGDRYDFIAELTLDP
ncbi:GntR family transcriptional regulator [Frigidibacter sp. ROC022]|uniref:GntR family transcriptional regulator n=1 Tax=Frigidibacter sp. ROC022 TaxID=2971796 RepID=UPI00215A4035|nr:GntR family transcriptional regulator [Frigidibacter sp. ROC022]MCR8724395.1 GntR family transcriptional regulator [Frigidibacter sp. ROC022]